MAGAKGIKAGRAFVELGVSDKLTRGLRRAQQRLKAFGASVTSIGKRLAGLSAAAALPFAFSARTFAGFEDQMKAVKAVTASTGVEFEKLYQLAKKLGATTSFTAGEVGAGMLNLARAGFTPAEIEAAIAGTLDLARATGTDLAQATEIAAGTLRAFGMEAGAIGHVGDVLVATANNSAQTLEDLGEAMKYVAPIADEYGLSLEETAKAVGLLANMQIKGSMAGTSMRMILLQLSDPSIRKRLMDIGISAKTLNGDFGELMLSIGNAMAGLSGTEKLALGKELFGQRAAGAGLKLGKDGAEKLAAAIDNAGGVAKRTAKVMDEGLGGAVRRLLSAFEGVQIAIGEAIAGPLGKVADMATLVGGAITAWVGANRDLILTVAAVVVGVGALGVTLVALGVTASAASFVLGGLATIASGIGAALAVLGSVVGAVITPMGLLVTAAGVLAGVIGVQLVEATGAGAAALSWLGDTFKWLKDRVGSVLSGIVSALRSGDFALATKVMWAGMKVAWLTGTKPLLDIWNKFRFAIETIAINAFAGIKGAWVEVSTWMWKNFPQTTAFIAKTWANLSGIMKTTWAKFQNWLSDKWLDVMGWFDDDLDVEFAKSIGRQELNEQLTEIENARKAAIDEAGRKAGLTDKEHEREKAAALAEVEVARLKALDELDTDNVDRIKAAQDALDEAKKDLDVALKKAKALDIDEVPELGKRRPGGDDIAKAVGEAVGEKMSSVVGTFNPAAVGQMGGGAIFKRIFTVSEETSKNTKRIARAVEKGPAFG